MGKGDVKVNEEKKVLITRDMIRGSIIKDPRCRCDGSRDISRLGNRSNRGRFSCLSETKVLLIFTRRENECLRRG